MWGVGIGRRGDDGLTQKQAKSKATSDPTWLHFTGEQAPSCLVLVCVWEVCGGSVWGGVGKSVRAQCVVAKYVFLLF